MPPKYSISTDNTANKSQRQSGKFSKAAKTTGTLSKPKDFRGKKLHEAGLPVDQYALLRNAIPNADGTSTLQVTNKNPSLLSYHGSKVNTAVAEKMISSADGARTSTSILLSGANDTAVWHSGYIEKKTTGQPQAHNLVRKANFKMASTSTSTKGVSDRSVSVAIGSIALASVAPAELADKAPRSSSTKEVAWANSLEERRNEVKLRIDGITLAPAERSFVNKNVSEYFSSISPSGKRRPQNKRSYSPPRKTKGGTYFKGGGYTDPDPKKPKLSPPSKDAELTAYITQPLRKQNKS
ncbi:MAG TPA: hypothetical protein VGQ51_06550 [Puia sp.]|jgi:VCBS repeat-containing protein|nr:hypothetical protein [Puia sp.]